MINNVEAFLIHNRDYKNNSKLLDFLTDDFGLIRLVANGIKNKKTKIQSFMRLKINFSGKGELKTLRSWEIADTPRMLSGFNLVLVMYINEIISKSVVQNQVNLCKDYHYFISNLSEDKRYNEYLLRLFENKLLSEAGYDIDFTVDNNGVSVALNKKYNFQFEVGFIEHNSAKIMGKTLLTFAKNNIPNKEELLIYKYINRIRIKQLLGGRKINSRDFFKIISP